MAFNLHRAHRAGLAAPELATADHPGCSPLAAVGATSFRLRPPNKDEAPDTVGAGRGNQASTDNPDFAKGRADDKTFATLRALLALAGHELRRTSADDGPRGFYVSRWGHVRELRDIDAVLGFAKQVGVQHE